MLIVRLVSSTLWLENYVLKLLAKGATIGIEVTEFSVSEGESVEVCVVLMNGTLERRVTVRLQTADGTATVGGIVPHYNPISL